MAFLVLGMYLGIFGLALAFSTSGLLWLQHPIGIALAIPGAACIGVYFDKLHSIDLRTRAHDLEKPEQEPVVER
jgi:hypothetical protein